MQGARVLWEVPDAASLRACCSGRIQRHQCLGFRYAKEAVQHAWQYAYIARKKKKSDRRGLWIVRLNAACRSNGITYSRFIEGLHAANIELDRKVLSDLAIRDEVAFTGLVKTVQAALQTKAAAPKTA